MVASTPPLATKKSSKPLTCTPSAFSVSHVRRMFVDGAAAALGDRLEADDARGARAGRRWR